MLKSTQIIRSLYFYVVSIVALFMLVFSCVDLVNIGLKTWAFPNSDPNYNTCIPTVPPTPTNIDQNLPLVASRNCDLENEQNRENISRQNQSSAVRDFSMLVVALPLFLFHFRIVQKEWKERKEV
jgi:hypothetical protein